ncbi:DsbA family protein [soil metagenome]
MSLLRRLFLIVLLALTPAFALASASQAQTLPPVTAADRVLGQADAPVTVVEYASFVCPHCAHWQATVFPEFKSRFIDTGKVKLVFRDLPTSPQNVASAAAMVGRCAAPGRFFAVAASFFAGQPALIAGGDGRVWFDNAIAQSGQTKEQMQACFADPARSVALTADINAAVAAGVNGTPTFFVNGKALAGDTDIEALATAIAAATPGT